MKAKQVIDLLENGIMPCVLSQLNIESSIDYIYKYSLSSSAYHRGGSYPSYQFITLHGNYLYANDLNEEIYSGGGAS